MNNDIKTIPDDLWSGYPQEKREALYQLADVLVEVVVNEIFAEQAEKQQKENPDPE